MMSAVIDIAHELAQALRQRRLGVIPRVHRGGLYPLLRCFTTVVTRDVTVATLIGDMYAGRSVVYADFVGYDEVAHHSGVERYESLDALRRLDREIGRLELAGRGAQRPYRLVVLSDHGQSQGMTFKDRYGYTLSDFVQRTVGDKVAEHGSHSEAAGAESWGYAGGLGGEQTHPFVLYPADLPLPGEPIHGAEHLHQVFKGWLAHLGHTAYVQAPADQQPTG